MRGALVMMLATCRALRPAALRFAARRRSGAALTTMSAAPPRKKVKSIVEVSPDSVIGETVTVSPITDSGVTSTIDLTFLRGGAADIVVSAAPLRRRAATRTAAGRSARQLASNITRTPRISQQLLAALLLLLADVH